MKKILPVFLFAFIFNSFGQNVVIPDANFKLFLLGDAAINTNSDTEIQLTEAQAYTGPLNASYQYINDMTGIEEFTALTYLNCSFNDITSLDVSALTQLTYFDCGFNDLTSIDISNNLDLTYFSCYGNLISNLDVSANTQLTSLRISFNPIASIDLSNNPMLDLLDMVSCQISTIDLSAQTSLTRLLCGGNLLTSLDISNNMLIDTLEMDSNQITTIDLSNNTGLRYLIANNNSLNSIDLTMHVLLTDLVINNNLLTSLDLSNNPLLIQMVANNNTLSSLDIKNGGNTNMQYFVASQNPNLTCIQVDDVAYSTTNWNLVDAGASFSENCFAGLTNLEVQNLKVYPNPTSDFLKIEYTEHIIFCKITDATGQIIRTEYEAEFSVNDLPAGSYFLLIQTDQACFSMLFVKK